MLHISENDLSKDIRGILKRVETGCEVIIEGDAKPFAVIRATGSGRRTIAEGLALLDPHSAATIDADFGKDVQTAVDAHREPLEPPAWD